MEQIAEAGKVLLTEHTAKLVSGFFQLRDLGSFEIKGMVTRFGSTSSSVWAGCVFAATTLVTGECHVLDLIYGRFADEAVAARSRSLRSESSVARSIHRSTRRLSRA
jgi:hypothetical protein